ncbi:MAP/microtubule affinity-regulating kinase [Actinidia chinensis var. chinensis]|uniref:MAP/microtubule affinity-regulating kinase n=1 Tax=Actinidia chinensis var. chinensis TaxID=1590841 RepID=A0A2R6QHF6_ACTCC|nr:MAP/microtubule affinity-regulating kinase [Actinidia chinensis var. chinensis]
MSYEGGTVNVGVRKERESHINLIHGGSDEIAHLVHRRGGGVRRSNHSGSLGKLSTVHRRCWRHDPFGRGAHLGPISRWRIFPHQLPPTRCAKVKHLVPRANKTIASIHPGEVAFYEAAFHAGLRLPIHPIIRRILYFYNICPSQLVLNAWKSLVRSKKTLLGGYHSNVKGWKKKFFFISGDDWEFSPGLSRDTSVPRVLRSWGTPSKYCNKPPILSSTKCFKSTPKAMVSSGEDNCREKLIGRAAPVASDETMSRRIDLGKPAKMAKGSKVATSISSKVATPKSSKTATLVAKGVVIREKCPKDDVPSILPNKKASMGTPIVAPEEGTSARLGDVLGLNASMLENSALAEKLLEGVIPPFNREEVINN